MKKYDITAEQVSIDHYKQSQYGKPDDASNYVRLEHANPEVNFALNGQGTTPLSRSGKDES